MSKFSEYVESDYDEEDSREPIRTRIQRKGVGIIEMISFSDETITYCPKCRAAGFQVKLGPRVLFPNEKRPPDYDRFLQCPDCGEVIAAYVVEHDATIIRDDIETVDNPFESNQSEILGANPRRTTKGGARAAERRKRNKTKFHDDPEINETIRKHGSDNVRIIQ